MIKWACPKCGAEAPGTGSSHGRGGAEVCKYDPRSKDCYGFVCECDTDSVEGHGDTPENPCPQANCYHCGWGGTFPPPRWKPSKLPKWARTALAEGWTAPDGWAPPKKGPTPRHAATAKKAREEP